MRGLGAIKRRLAPNYNGGSQAKSRRTSRSAASRMECAFAFAIYVTDAQWWTSTALGDKVVQQNEVLTSGETKRTTS